MAVTSADQTTAPAATTDQGNGQQPSAPNAQADLAAAQKPGNIQTEHDSTLDNAQLTDQAQPIQSQGPNIVRPVRRSGLAGIVDEIRDAISGTQTSQMYQDDEGNKYIQHPDMTSGQKWLKIAGTALHGAAAGYANGQGPGGSARAFQAGVSVGDKQAEAEKQKEQSMNEEVKQAQLDKFNNVKLKHDLAASEFALTRMQVKATQDDVDFSQKQIDRERGLGSADLGVYQDPAALAKVQEQDPTFWKNVYKNNIVAVPEIGEDGTRQGIHVFLRTPGIGNQMAEKGTQVMDFVPGEKPGDAPKLVPRTLTIPATHDQVDAYNNAATTKYQSTVKSIQDIADKKKADELRDAQIKTQGTEQVKNMATARKEDVEAAVAKAKSGDNSTLVDMIGTGRMPAGRLSYIMARNPDLLTQVTKAYPDFDGSKIDAYTNVVKDFESTKKGSTGAALNAGATALKHLKELRDLNTTASHIPGSPAWNAYHNKADTVSTELATFYGDSTIPGIASIKGTLASNLPGTRQTAIETQAKSMGDKLDSYEQSWQEAAPSKAYEAAMPQIDAKAKEARAALDPIYKQRAVSQQNGGNAATPSTQTQTARQPVKNSTPQTHQFSLSAWQSANPHGDVNAAKAAAQQQGYQVVQ